MHIAITIPYKPETAKGDVLSLMNFIDHEDNPFSKTINFKSFDPQENLFLCVLLILQKEMHLLSRISASKSFVT